MPQDSFNVQNFKQSTVLGRWRPGQHALNIHSHSSKHLNITVVPDVAGTANNLTEEKISDKCFELMFAFDEVR